LRRAQVAGVPHPVALASSGDPVIQICRAAEDHDVDVIVVGTHHKTALRQLFDPSVSTGVVRESLRPVLVVSGVVNRD
jgi:nucleotide-binding universal stress UspA family protein